MSNPTRKIITIGDLESNSGTLNETNRIKKKKSAAKKKRMKRKRQAKKIHLNFYQRSLLADREEFSESKLVQHPFYLKDDSQSRTGINSQNFSPNLESSLCGKKNMLAEILKSAANHVENETVTPNIYPHTKMFRNYPESSSQMFFTCHHTDSHFYNINYDILNNNKFFDLQVIIMGDPYGASLSKSEAIEAYNILSTEVENFLLNECNYKMKLLFHSFQYQEPGCCTIDCGNGYSFDWILHWSKLKDSKKFYVVRSIDAPWKFSYISFSMSQENFKLERTSRLLKFQNRNLNLDAWKFLNVDKEKGKSILYFKISTNERKLLEKGGWTLHYELGTIKVNRCSERLFLDQNQLF